MFEKEYIIHHSYLEEYKLPFGAVPTGTEIKLWADIKEQGDPMLHFVPDGQEEICIAPDNTEALGQGFRSGFTLLGSLVSQPGVYFYYFTCNGRKSGESRITVYRDSGKVPSWFTDGVIYQIFPDRFCKGEGPVEIKEHSFMYTSWEDLPVYVKDSRGQIIKWDFYGGNLWGVADMTDHIKSLGADIIYLNPIFQARSNHRYDTGNYKKVDGLLGGDEAFDHMISQGKAKGMRFILDGVFSHTGCQSVYFDPEGRFEGEKEKYKEWYNFRPDGSYECWWGVEDLPNVNELAPSYLDYIVEAEDSVISHWYEKGISGWRLDVADELPDEFIYALRRRSDRYGGVVIGEVWEDASCKISYDIRRKYYTEPELHSNTNYLFRNTLLEYFGGNKNAGEAMAVFYDMYEHYPRENFYAQVNMTSSHDVKRLMTCMLEICGDSRDEARELVKCYSLIQFCFPGVPLVYYGDESCVEGGADPDNRRTFPHGNLDADMVEWFGNLGRIRNSEDAFKGRGQWRPIKINDDIFAFERYTDDKKYIIMAGPGKDIGCDIAELLPERYAPYRKEMIISCKHGILFECK